MSEQHTAATAAACTWRPTSLPLPAEGAVGGTSHFHDRRGHRSEPGWHHHVGSVGTAYGAGRRPFRPTAATRWTLCRFSRRPVRQEGRALALTPFDIANGRVVGRATLAGGDAVGVLWDTDGVPRALPNSHEGTLINRDGVIGDVRMVGDDGTFGGQRPDAARQHSLPTVWRCG